jgi:hypothetical protein
VTATAARALAVVGVLACASPRAPQEAVAPTISAPVACTADRGDSGWVEQRVVGTPLAFCAPPDIRVEGSRRFGPSGPLPYPRSYSIPSWMEEWRRASGGRWILIAAHYALPNRPPDVPTDAKDVRHSIVAPATRAIGPAVLREYRVDRDPARTPVLPGGDEPRGFGTSPHRADLVVSLGPGAWVVLEANLEDPAERTPLVRILRSARLLDR